MMKITLISKKMIKRMYKINKNSELEEISCKSKIISYYNNY